MFYIKNEVEGFVEHSYPLNVVISASEADSKFLELTPNGNSKFTVKQHDPKKKER